MAPRNFSEDGAFGGSQTGGAIDTALPDNGSSESNFGSMNMLGMSPMESGGGMGGAKSIPGSSRGYTDWGGTQGAWGGGVSDSSGGAAAPLSAPMGGGGWGGGGLTSAPPRPDTATKAIEDQGFINNFTSFAGGGAIDEESGDVGGGMDNGLGRSIQQALGAVGAALSYGRKLHGLEGGEQQTAGRMPTIPGDQSESGVPREQPMPGPLPPTDNPFGKRADVMPAAPFSETPREQPMPGPLPPTDNPFGKRRADAGEAIDTDEEAA